MDDKMMCVCGFIWGRGVKTIERIGLVYSHNVSSSVNVFGCEIEADTETERENEVLNMST